MDGICYMDSEEVKVVYIENLTEEIKKELNNYIRVICHGDGVNDEFEPQNYLNTLNEFISRYPKENDKRKGYIGELLLNFIIRNYMNNYTVVSPFFNKEDASSAKKGFDIIIAEKDKKDSLWLVEAKSGTVSDKTNIHKKISEKIHEAKRDFLERLTKNDNSSLWLNARNDIRLCLDSGDEMKSLMSILSLYSTNKDSRKYKVILAGTVFHDMNDKFSVEKIHDVYKKIKEAEKFGSIKIIALQKGTYEKIYSYFESLVKNSDKYNNS